MWLPGLLCNNDHFLCFLLQFFPSFTHSSMLQLPESLCLIGSKKILRAATIPPLHAKSALDSRYHQVYCYTPYIPNVQAVIVMETRFVFESTHHWILCMASFTVLLSFLLVFLSLLLHATKQRECIKEREQDSCGSVLKIVAHNSKCFSEH